MREGTHMKELTFEAQLPTDATMPVKPTRDINPKTLKRRVRVWLDAYLSPGETEMLLLLGEETFDVTVARRRPQIVPVGINPEPGAITEIDRDGAPVERELEASA